MDDVFSILEEIATIRKFKAGDKFFLQGDPSEGIYIVAEGRVKLSRVSKEGYESVLCMRGPHNIFCPVPILDKGEQLGTATALTDGSLFRVEQQKLLDRCQKHPELVAYIQGDCLHEVRQLLVRLESFAFRSIRERLAFTLLDISRRQEDRGESATELTLTQQELAGLIGASRESVSRTLSNFEARGILSTHRGGLVILDPEKLKLISG